MATATFAAMAGIFHSYYTVVLAPGIAALVATGAWLAWERRDEPSVRRALSGTVLATVLLAAGTVAAVGYELRWTSVPILAGGVATAVLLHPRTGPSRLTATVAAAAVAASLAGPALFARRPCGCRTPAPARWPAPPVIHELGSGRVVGSVPHELRRSAVVHAAQPDGGAHDRA